MRLVAAMSGGVDSAVAAARMLAEGHDVVGVHLALNRSASVLRERASGCCSLEDAADARRVADRLGIPFYVWDLAQEFHEEVVEDFLAEYAAGHTPNPCLRCNERIKFAALADKALALGFEGVATGHYARIVPAEQAKTGRRELHRALDPDKDQSYVLGVLDDTQLAAAHFPLGGFFKSEVRDQARDLGLSVAAKPDSHDICFVDTDTRSWLQERLGSQPGPIIDETGAEVGEHDGAYAFTVGQRRGLRVPRPAADGRPRYVVRTEVSTNTVVIGPAQLLRIEVITGRHLRWCGPVPSGRIRLGVQLRAHAPELPATVEVGEDQIRVELDEATRGVAAGQTAVLYDGTRVVGSATITGTGRRPIPS